jgi:hypothetical protein
MATADGVILKDDVQRVLPTDPQEIVCFPAEPVEFGPHAQQDDTAATHTLSPVNEVHLAGITPELG